jgi:hypothetical protein
MRVPFNSLEYRDYYLLLGVFWAILAEKLKIFGAKKSPLVRSLFCVGQNGLQKGRNQ